MRRTALKRRTPLRRGSVRLQTRTTLRSTVSLGRSSSFLRRKVKLRKHSLSPLSVLERALWALCKAIVRAIHPNVCYTCGRPGLKGRNWQTGHMWKKSGLGAFMKYDLRILRPQCYHCNIDLDGNARAFERRMRKEIGEEKWAELEKDRRKSVRAYDHYTALIPIYSDILERTKPAKDNFL